jgi:hypothetical protein
MISFIAHALEFLLGSVITVIVLRVCAAATTKAKMRNGGGTVARTARV